MSRRDLLILQMMVRENTRWEITTHNGHVSEVCKVGQKLRVQDMPEWWLEYFAVNDIRIG